MPDEEPRAALSDKQARGGVIGGKGYGFQAAYIVSHIPIWLDDPDFAQFLQEGAGDVDVRFNRDDGEERWYVQVKDYAMTPSTAREVFRQFHETNVGTPGTYTRFTLACPGLNPDVKRLRSATEELRGAAPFYRPGQDEILDNTWTGLEDLVTELKLPIDTSFLVDKVHFDTDLAGLTDDADLRDLFVGRLLKSKKWATMTPKGAAHAYEKLALLSYQKLRQTCSREQVEALIEEIVGELPAAVAYVKGLPTPPTPYFAHPYPAQEHFTGRERERARLSAWLTADTAPLLAVIAIGGMGKSALAWHWLQNDLLPAGFDCWDLRGALWWGFYDRESGFERFLERAVAYVSRGEMDAVKWSVRDRMECLAALLAERRFLLVLDGVERLLRAYARMDAAYLGDDDAGRQEAAHRQCADPNVGTFFQWLAGLRATKTLLTTRLLPRELERLMGVTQIDLKQMDPDDAVRFFQTMQIRGTRAEIQTACKPYGYLPLALRLLGGLVAEDPARPGDIAVATEYEITEDLRGKEQHHILERSYDALSEQTRKLLSRIAAFRSPVGYGVLRALFGPPTGETGEEKEGFCFESERALKDALQSLVRRGLLSRQEGTARYDLHPVVRRYAYDRLADKEGTHTRLRDYFAAVPEPERVESLDDLAPTIELYHHTVRAGQYDEARRLFRDRLGKLLYYRFGAYGLVIELLCALFPGGEPFTPSGEAALPQLSEESDQAWTLNTLAISYSLSGQPSRTVPLFEAHNRLREKADSKSNLAIGLGNLAFMAQISIGALAAAEGNLRRMIALCREIEDEFRDAVGHRELGRLLAYTGAFEEAGRELEIALASFGKLGATQSECVVWAYRALRSLLMGDADAVLEAARHARELADERSFEVDIVRAEWLLGAAQRAREELAQAEPHLERALRRCRRINSIMFEPDILLELARLRYAQAGGASEEERPGPRASGEGDSLRAEALKLAREALGIADRCEYRLVQADCHNFLAQVALEDGNLPEARRHAEIGRERAECDGPGHRYEVAFQEAERLLGEIESR